MEFIKNFPFADSSELIGVRVFGLVSSKMFDSHFLEMMYVEFIKNSFLADSSEQSRVRVVSAS